MFRIKTLNDMLVSKKISAQEITEICIDNANKYDNKINSFIVETFDVARKTAKEVDNKIANNENISILGGIPYGIKDNIATTDIITTSGSRILENYVPSYDATVYAQMKKEDGILIGKLNLDEFGVGDKTISFAKQTHNPWNTDYDANGSSGGSAVFLACNYGLFTFGSDTGGSVREPAGKCGVVGFKPSYGAISRYGLSPYAHSLDQVGIITNDVVDNAIVMGCVAKKDNRDNTSIHIDFDNIQNRVTKKLDKIKVAVVTEIFEETSEEYSYILDFIKQLEQNEQYEISYVSLKEINETASIYKIITSVEGFSNFNMFDGITYSRRVSCDNTYDTILNSRKEGLGSRVKQRIIMGAYLNSEENRHIEINARNRIKHITNKYNEILQNADVILTPLTSYGKGVNIVTLSNITKSPAISIPLCLDKNGVPVGVHLMGKYKDDVRLLNIAYNMEQLIQFKEVCPINV